MNAFGGSADSRGELLDSLQGLGFDISPFVALKKAAGQKEIEMEIASLKALAADREIPIDGIVLRYDSLAYSKRLGRNGHHYKDGIAFKFEDDTYETVFRSIEWEAGRTGEIAPVAVFDTVEIDGCAVSRDIVHL